MRPKDKSDPDPKLATVILHIWPWMFLITVANLVFLVFIAGLAGWLIFPALVICYAIDHLALSYFCKVVERDGDPEDGHETAEGNEETKSFIPMAALASLWLPSVVGPQHSRIFLVSGLASLVSKVLLLVVAVALAEAGLLTSVHPRPFLLFCFNENPPHLNETHVTPCRFSEHNVSEGTCFLTKNMTHEKKLANALADLEKALEEYNRIVESIDDDQKAESIEGSALFQNTLNTSPLLDEVKKLKGRVDKELRSSGTGKVQQKIRICMKNETPFRLGLLSGLLVVVALAVYAIYRLHRIADYRVFKL